MPIVVGKNFCAVRTPVSVHTCRVKKYGNNLLTVSVDEFVFLLLSDFLLLK